MGSKIWNKRGRYEDSNIFNIKLKIFSNFLKGWSSNNFGHSKKTRKELQEELEVLGSMEEVGHVSPELCCRWTAICVEINEILVDKECIS